MNERKDTNDVDNCIMVSTTQNFTIAKKRVKHYKHTQTNCVPIKEFTRV